MADPTIHTPSPTSAATPGRGSARSSRERILTEALAMIEAHGEAGLRVEVVLERSDASASSMYHHFGSREGLIEAAQIEAFARQTSDDVESLRAALSAETREELLVQIDELTRLTTEPDRAASRRKRLATLGSATSRPELWAALGAEQQRITDSFAEILARAQGRQLIRDDLDPHALAEFVLSYAFGHVLSDLCLDPAPTSEWRGVVDLVVRAFVVND